MLNVKKTQSSAGQQIFIKSSNSFCIQISGCIQSETKEHLASNEKRIYEIIVKLFPPLACLNILLLIFAHRS